MKVFTNHLGYAPYANKRAIIEAPQEQVFGGFALYASSNPSQAVYQGQLQALGRVDQWRDWHFWQADFSDFQDHGRYHLHLLDANLQVLLVADSFEIRPDVLGHRLVSDMLYFFKSQRCSGIYDRADHAAALLDSDTRLDVHGGWYDASGDVSKYLSHLSYANYLNPQQTPMVVWNMLAALPALSAAEGGNLPKYFQTRLHDEIAHGADFLCRMQAPAGYFYTTVFDRWSKDPAQRDVCSYSTQKGHKSSDYAAGYRQGAGVSIAALARASRVTADEYSAQQYLAAAELGFAHLESHNLAYLDDGIENIIDDYCALLAATELYAATQQASYQQAAQSRAAALCNRLTPQGWWRADDAAQRSYFHAAEAGLPVLALLRYLEVFPLAAPDIVPVVVRALQFELEMTAEQNPFGYPRQYVKQNDAGQVQFFIPHDNPSGYWWQGENARLASLSAMATAALKATTVHPELWQGLDLIQLKYYAQAPLDWILGLNPFDACMLHGHGRNNPAYEHGYDNAPGGVCNGITSGLLNEQDIDFQSSAEAGMDHSWRWTEQWIPHAGWLFLALALRMEDACKK